MSPCLFAITDDSYVRQNVNDSAVILGTTPGEKSITNRFSEVKKIINCSHQPAAKSSRRLRLSSIHHWKESNDNDMESNQTK